MIKEYFKIAIKNLKTRSLRSLLTILGVVIGVFLVVALLSLSRGIENAILTQIRMMGEDVLMVMPGVSFSEGEKPMSWLLLLPKLPCNHNCEAMALS